MVTTYNITDMVKFGQSCVDLKEKGMLFPDEKISKQHVENWKVGLDCSKPFFCPKVQEIAHALISKGVKIEMDEDDNVINGITNLHYEAIHQGVIIVAYNLKESIFSIQGSRKHILYINNVFNVEYNQEKTPYVKCNKPHFQFPIYKNGKIESIGVVIHEDDLFPVNSK